MKCIAVLFLFISYSISSQQPFSNAALLELILEYTSAAYPSETLSEFLYVGIRRQKMYHIKNNKIFSTYPVSTSSKGAGNNIGSFKTPTGLHFIAEKIGDNAPVATLFINKKNTGKVVPVNITEVSSNKDEITSRVLSLKGLQQGINKGKKYDTFARGIYIHGTSDEASIGKPSSHGCIRMKNDDIIELFDLLSVGTKVVLLNN
ncbi:MAG: L,D-transpeptidase [Bacteroidota bacterium]|nr:L,D-transpeptidase [Bacteroidota bacterium]